MAWGQQTHPPITPSIPPPPTMSDGMVNYVTSYKLVTSNHYSTAMLLAIYSLSSGQPLYVNFT